MFNTILFMMDAILLWSMQYNIVMIRSLHPKWKGTKKAIEVLAYVYYFSLLEDLPKLDFTARSSCHYGSSTY